MSHRGILGFDNPDLPPPPPPPKKWRAPGERKPEDHKEGLSEATIMLIFATIFLVIQIGRASCRERV